LAWLLLSPLPSALTSDGAMHATRLVLMLPPLIFITALGFQWLTSLLSKKRQTLLYIIFSIALLLNVSAYLYRYSSHYKFESARHWQDGYQQIFSQLTPHLKTANRIFINNTYEPSILKFAFFSLYPPKEFQQNFITDISQENVVTGFNGFKLGDKYYFGRIADKVSFQDLLMPNNIYLAVQGQEVPGDWDWSKEPPENLKILNYTKDVFGNPLFYLVSRK